MNEVAGWESYKTQLRLGDPTVIVIYIQRELLYNELIDDGLVLSLKLIFIVRDLLK